MSMQRKGCGDAAESLYGPLASDLWVYLYITPADLTPVYSQISELSRKKVDTKISDCYTYVVSHATFVTPVHKSLRRNV